MNICANYLVEIVPQTFRKFNLMFALMEKYGTITLVCKVHALGIINV